MERLSLDSQESERFDFRLFVLSILLKDFRVVSVLWLLARSELRSSVLETFGEHLIMIKLSKFHSNNRVISVAPANGPG